MSCQSLTYYENKSAVLWCVWNVGKESKSRIGLYDYSARFYDPAIARWHVVDPLTEKNHSQSGFVYAANNPIKYIDFMGMDTLDIEFGANATWEKSNAQIVEVFRVTKDGKTTTYTFSAGEYGERVNMLNLETNDDYTLGVYHVSGEPIPLIWTLS